MQRLQPTKIVDCGIGFGKYGVLCREILDAVDGRVKHWDWKVEIDGIEAWKKYTNGCWNAYNTVSIADFTQMYQEIKDYDLVLMIDSLEHMEKDLAYKILDTLLEANKNVIVSVPVGVCPQGAVFGNPFEEHKASWYSGDFDRYLPRRVLHSGVCHVVRLGGANGVS